MNPISKTISIIVLAMLFVSVVGIACDDAGDLPDNTCGGLGPEACSLPVAAGAVIAANQVEAMGLGSTAWGIARALAGKAGTIVMSNGDWYLFGWSVPDLEAWAFWVYDTHANKAITNPGVLSNGQAVSCKTFRELVTFMEGNGWKVTPPNILPFLLKDLLAGLTANAARNWTTFVVLFPPGEEFTEQMYELLDRAPEGPY